MGKEKLRAGWKQPHVRKARATSSPGGRNPAPHAGLYSLARRVYLDLSASVTYFKATLNIVGNISLNTEDLFLPRSQDQFTKQNKINAENIFLRTQGYVLYLQSLQLLQVLEGASLDDAHLIVFQMPGIRKAARVKG